MNFINPLINSDYGSVYFFTVYGIVLYHYTVFALIPYLYYSKCTIIWNTEFYLASSKILLSSYCQIHGNPFTMYRNIISLTLSQYCLCVLLRLSQRCIVCVSGLVFWMTRSCCTERAGRLHQLGRAGGILSGFVWGCEIAEQEDCVPNYTLWKYKVP
jgi:hypothetical protein